MEPLLDLFLQQRIVAAGPVDRHGIVGRGVHLVGVVHRGGRMVHQRHGSVRRDELAVAEGQHGGEDKEGKLRRNSEKR